MTGTSAPVPSVPVDVHFLSTHALVFLVRVRAGARVFHFCGRYRTGKRVEKTGVLCNRFPKAEIIHLKIHLDLHSSHQSVFMIKLGMMKVK